MGRWYRSFLDNLVSNSIETFFFCPPPFDRTSIYLSADQYGAMLNFGFTSSDQFLESSDCTSLHLSTIRSWRTPASSSRPISLCRSNWVVNFDIWKQQGSLDLFTSASIYCLCSIDIKVPIACWWRFQYWSRLCSWFPESSLQSVLTTSHWFCKLLEFFSVFCHEVLSDFKSSQESCIRTNFAQSVLLW